MATIYNKQGDIFNPSSVIDRIGEISSEIDKEYEVENVDHDKVLRLMASQLAVGMRLSTRYGVPRAY